MLALFILIGFCAVAYGKYASAAFDFHKQRVGFGFAGVGLFLASNYLLQFLAGIIIGLVSPASLTNVFLILFVALAAYVAGLIITIWLILPAFKKSWAKKQSMVEEELLDKEDLLDR